MTNIFGTEHEGTHHDLLGGDQFKFKFANGYSASVVRHPGSYGSAQGKWELAVLDSSNLSETDVAETLKVIEALPKAGA